MGAQICPLDVAEAMHLVTASIDPKKHDDSGVYIWSKSLMAEAQKTHKLGEKLNSIWDKETFDGVNIFGKMRRVFLPNLSSPEKKLGVHLLRIKEIVEDLAHEDTTPDSAGPLYELVEVKSSEHESKCLCIHQDPPWRFWKNMWETGNCELGNKFWSRKISEKGELTYGSVTISEDPKVKNRMQKQQAMAEMWKMLSDRLRTIITKHAEKLNNVDKIVCFGLGTLN
jgi:hypothetical protein